MVTELSDCHFNFDWFEFRLFCGYASDCSMSCLSSRKIRHSYIYMTCSALSLWQRGWQRRQNQSYCKWAGIQTIFKKLGTLKRQQRKKDIKWRAVHTRRFYQWKNKMSRVISYHRVHQYFIWFYRYSYTRPAQQTYWLITWCVCNG